MAKHEQTHFSIFVVEVLKLFFYGCELFLRLFSMILKESEECVVKTKSPAMKDQLSHHKIEFHHLEIDLPLFCLGHFVSSIFFTQKKTFSSKSTLHPLSGLMSFIFKSIHIGGIKWKRKSILQS